MAGIKIENLWKKYGDVEAVQGISLEIEEGEFMALLGPSGCGKSSTMRMIAGLESVTDGGIFFDGELVNQKRPRDRNVAMAFETYALYPTMNVYENLAFPLWAKKKSKEQIERRVKEVAEIVDITHLLESKTGELSSGQQQSVGLARALMRQPSILLLDEPISHLDSRQRVQMRAYLKSLHLELGYTMLYVTHDQEEAMAMADRMAVMSVGVINQVGTSQEIFNHPKDMFVAGFIGEPAMNFIECTLVSKGDLTGLKLSDIFLDMPPQYQALANLRNISQNLILGIRPHYITLHREKSPAAYLPAAVFVVEPLGDTTVVTVDLMQTRFQVVTDPNFEAEQNDTVWLEFEPERVLLFDPKTEKAINGK